MIKTFGNQLAEDLFHNRKTKEVRRFPADLIRIAHRKLSFIHYAGRVEDLLIPPGNRLEKKKGDLKDFWSIRINDQWRIIFRWDKQDAYDVQVLDYH